MSQITWVETIPSGTSLAGNAPTDFPRVWKAVTSGMTLEHFWNASGGDSEASAGELRLGASRVSIRAYSTDATADSQVTGRMAIITTGDSSTSYVPFRLLVYDSTGTFLAGTSWLDEHATSAGTGYWLRQSGSTAGIGTGTGTASVTFGTPYMLAPQIFLTPSNYSWVFFPLLVSAGLFTSAYSSLAGASGTATLYWESLGTVSSASY